MNTQENNETMRFWSLGGFGAAMLALAMTLTGGQTAKAQWAVYGQGTYANLNQNNASNTYGGAFGFYREKQMAPVSVALDFRGMFTGGGNSQGNFTDSRLAMGLIGVRAAWTNKGSKFVPYVEGALGPGYFREGIGLSRQDKHSATEQVMGGVDFRVLPNWDWRVAEFSYGRLVGQLSVIHPYVISTGVVFHIQ